MYRENGYPKKKDDMPKRIVALADTCLKSAKELIALGAVEGQNNKAKVTTKKAYGFKSFEVVKLALYYRLEKLPEQVATHIFCGWTKKDSADQLVDRPAPHYQPDGAYSQNTSRPFSSRPVSRFHAPSLDR